jgi:hypothetical protein
MLKSLGIANIDRHKMIDIICADFCPIQVLSVKF